MAKNGGSKTVQSKGGSRTPADKEVMQCEYCFKSAREGTALSKCADCKTVLYCSRQCQKASWPTHKETCRKNQWAAAELKRRGVNPMTPFNAFFAAHRPTISKYGLCAFNLAEPAPSMNEVLVFAFRPRPGSQSMQSSYILVDVHFRKVETFGSRMDELRQWMEEHQTHFLKTGHMGGIWLMLIDTESQFTEFCAVGYEKKNLRDPMWKEKLFILINSGTRL